MIEREYPGNDLTASSQKFYNKINFVLTAVLENAISQLKANSSSNVYHCLEHHVNIVIPSNCTSKILRTNNGMWIEIWWKYYGLHN